MHAIGLAVSLAVGLAGCTIAGSRQGPAAPVQLTEDMMPSSVLDHQDPGADTSRNPELSRSSSGSLLDDIFGGFRHWGGSSPAFGGPAETPHYYRGCRGCSSEHPDGALVLGAVLALGMLRRRSGKS
jgi:MYXO-CTERM domain-containing protein